MFRGDPSGCSFNTFIVGLVDFLLADILIRHEVVIPLINHGLFIASLAKATNQRWNTFFGAFCRTLANHSPLRGVHRRVIESSKNTTQKSPGTVQRYGGIQQLEFTQPGPNNVRAHLCSTNWQLNQPLTEAWKLMRCIDRNVITSD